MWMWVVSYGCAGMNGLERSFTKDPCFFWSLSVASGVGCIIWLFYLRSRSLFAFAVCFYFIRLSRENYRALSIGVLEEDLFS